MQLAPINNLKIEDPYSLNNGGSSNRGGTSARSNRSLKTLGHQRNSSHAVLGSKFQLQEVKIQSKFRAPQNKPIKILASSSS